MKDNLLKIIVATAIILPNLAVAKPCGNGYIRDDYVCHQGDSRSESSSNAPSPGKVILVAGILVGTMFLLAAITGDGNHRRNLKDPDDLGSRVDSLEKLKSFENHDPNIQQNKPFESFIRGLGGTLTVGP